MSRRSTLASAALAALAFALGAAVAQAQPQRFVTVGTGGIVGVYYPLAGAICRFVNAARKMHGLRCAVESTGGSVANVNAVMAGELDAGFAQSDVQYYALRGEGPFQGRPQEKLRALFAVYPEVFTLVVRRDAGVAGFADLKGKRAALGDPGSGTRATTELVMQAFGLRKEDLRLAAELKFVELAPALCDDRIDAFTFVGGHPNAIVHEAAGACASSVAAVAGPGIDKLVKERPYYAKANIPGGIYKGSEKTQPSFGVLATVIVSADLPEAVAHALVKSLLDNFEDFRKLHPAVTHIAREQMLEGNSAPYHPGALRAFREAGMLK